ncbi:MAG: hypothetical protein ACYSUX_00150 [Planctomycetota bacterium]|jgi:hypothetical protein
MISTAGRIIKSSDVKLEGQFHLGLTKDGSGLPKQQVKASTAPQVRILENHPEYAVVEVTCCCGTKMSVKCEYAGAAQAPDVPHA